MTDTPTTPENEDTAEPVIIEMPSNDGRVAELEAEVAKFKDQALRALAEQENVRRRAQRDREDALKFATSGFAKDLVTVADNLRRAIDSVPEAQSSSSDLLKNLISGVSATERELLGAFEKHGIKKLDPLGEKFDHNFHQAIFELENTASPPARSSRCCRPATRSMTGCCARPWSASPRAPSPSRPHPRKSPAEERPQAGRSHGVRPCLEAAFRDFGHESVTGKPCTPLQGRKPTHI